MAKPGLYENIHKKRERIKNGSGEKMKKPGADGAPTAKDFKESAKTARRTTIEKAYEKWEKKEQDPTLDK